MSAIWSLTGAKRTWQGKIVSVAIDPNRTSGLAGLQCTKKRTRTVAIQHRRLWDRRAVKR